MRFSKVGVYTNKEGTDNEFDLVVKFDTTFVNVKPNYVDYHGRKVATRTGVPAGITCGYRNNAECSTYNTAQINV